MALGHEITLLTDAGPVRLVPAVIPNPGGMVEEVDGVSVYLPDGQVRLLTLEEAWRHFRGSMNNLQIAHLMGWKICVGCESAAGTSEGQLCYKCWKAGHSQD